MDKKTDYAIRAVAYLASCYENGEAVSASQIAEGSGAPRKYLAHILLALKKKALIKSSHGRGGGYKLMRRPELISVLEIVDAVGNSVDTPQSISTEGGKYRMASERVGKETKTAVRKVLSKLSVADLLSEEVV